MDYNIRERRKQKGYTQQQLADTLNVSRVTLRKIENMDESIQLSTYKSCLDILGLEIHVHSKNGPLSEVENFAHEVMEQLGLIKTNHHRYRHGWVYIMTHEDIIKIGVTQRDIPEIRAHEIYEQTGRKCTVYYTKLVTDIWDTEKQLHNIFEDNKLHGEWFAVDKDIAKEKLKQFH